MAIHQGGKLKHLVAIQNITNTELAVLWKVSEATIYNYFNMEEIPSKKLREICKVMDWDYMQEFVTGNNSLEFEALKRENQLLREQVEQLKEIIALNKKNK